MTNVFLLLSAMLSALIGVGPSARAVQAPVAVASIAQEQAAPIVVHSVAARPRPVFAVALAFIAIGAIARLIPAVMPAWKMRRRE